MPALAVQTDMTAAPLALTPLDGPKFLHFLSRHGRSEAAGPISSQYEKELREGDAEHGAFLFSACGNPVAALSYGRVPLPRRSGAFSGRLDTVVARDDLRGNGLGGILMCEFIVRLHDDGQAGLAHLSTVAVHPSVASWATRMGFDRARADKVPLFQVDLESPKRRLEIVGRAKAELRKRMVSLSRRCGMCMRSRGQNAWCGGTPS